MFNKQGFVKMYAPNGAEVYLPFDPANARQLLAQYEQQGMSPVSLTEYDRERRSRVGAFVVRLHINGDGSETPVVDIYFRHRNGYTDRLRSMRVYLNTERDITRFETAFGVSLQSLPFYENDTPIDRNKVRPGQEQYIRYPACPVWVVWRLNPASENDEQATKRLFIRWERGKCTQRQQPQQPPQHQAADQAPEPQPQPQIADQSPQSQPQDTGEAEPEPQPQDTAANAEERYHFSTKPIVAAVSKVWEMPPAKVVPALYKAFGGNGNAEITVAQAIAWAQQHRPAAA